MVSLSSWQRQRQSWRKCVEEECIFDYKHSKADPKLSPPEFYFSLFLLPAFGNQKNKNINQRCKENSSEVKANKLSKLKTKNDNNTQSPSIPVNL